jgi:hypothetical protein
METTLEHLLTSSHKAEMVSYMKSHPEDFDELIQLALSNKQPYSWRASWVVWSCMDDNDKRLRKHIKTIVKILPSVNDSQQRELMMVLERMVIPENQEGVLFDICTTIWSTISKQPSVRYHAFKTLMMISEKHPSLRNEIKSLTESHYMESLSPGVKHSISKLVH